MVSIAVVLDPLLSCPQDEERAKIKEHIVELMLRAPPKIQAQISEALSIISSHDFPAKWLDLLPQLVSKMGAAMAQAPGSLDLAVLTGVLQTANSIFKRFRHAMKSEALWTELKYCLDGFVPPLLEVLKALGEMVGQCAAAASGPEAAVDPQVKATLLALVQGQRLVCRIFFSLNWQELPEVFEDHLTTWMGEFHKYLTYDFPVLVETDTEKVSTASARSQSETHSYCFLPGRDVFYPGLLLPASHSCENEWRVATHPKK